MRRFVTLGFVLLTLGLSGCPRPEKPSNDKIRIVATIPPLADLARQVGGGRVEVYTLLSPGASPHTFEPTPAQARAAADADLILRVGVDADHWIEGLLPANVPVVTATELKGVELIAANHHEPLENSPHGVNPHVWLDPLYAKLIVLEISSQLSRIDPQGQAVYQENSRDYLLLLDSLDAEIASTVDGFTSTEYVSFHPAWEYFARRYGLKRVAVIAESPGKEPTARHLEKVVSEIRETGVCAVFAEPQLSPKSAEVIATEAGAKVVFLDPLGEDEETYIQLMDRNLKALTGVLGEK